MLNYQDHTCQGAAAAQTAAGSAQPPAAAAHEVGEWMFEASPDCVKLLDVQGRLLRMNRNGQRLMEIDAFGPLEGVPWHTLWPAAARNGVMAAVAAARRGEVSQFQAACPSAKGSPRWWDVTVSPVLQDGAVTHLISFSRDATALVQALASVEEAREASEHARRAKAGFVASLGHEIRTPMNAIVGLTQVLLRAGLDKHQGLLVEKVQHAGQHLLGLLDDLLDLSNAEAGRLVLHERDFRLADVLERVRSMVDERARDKGLALELRVDDSVEQKLFGDPARLCQILLNFVANAIKFTQRGEVTISVRAAERGTDSTLLCFEVSDTGPGLAQAEIDSLFGDVDASRPGAARDHGGKGLGMAISKRLAVAMGGEVGVHSAPGLGSTFWFTVRLRLGRADGTAMAVFADPPAVLQGKRVLVVDDDALNREVVQQLLGLAGVAVSVAVNGQEAVEAMHQGEFDTVLMDVLMPVMDGLEATRRLRAMPKSSFVPVIAMTANIQDADRRACAEAGANDFIAKPIDTGKLWSVVAHWASQERKRLTAPVAAGREDVFYQPTVPGALV